MKYQGIIFDLDGVICHTDEYHYKAWKMLADRLDIYFDYQINDKLRGISRMESLEILLENYSVVLSQEKKEQLAEEKNKYYKDLLKNMTPKDLSIEVKETLDTLRAQGIKLAIGSSSKNAIYILQQIGLGGYFDAILDGNQISNSKPDPEVFLKAAEKLFLKPQECLVVEDAVSGLLAAKRGGMDCVGIGAAEKSSLAVYHIQRIKDLLSMI